MERGTIVLSRFPFTDLSSTKRRPCVIVSKVASDKADVIVAFISSVIPVELSRTDFLLERGDIDFGETGLRRSSIVKLDKLATLEKSIFSGEIGKLTDRLMQEIDLRLMIALDLNT